MRGSSELRFFYWGDTVLFELGRKLREQRSAKGYSEEYMAELLISPEEHFCLRNALTLISRHSLFKSLHMKWSE